MKNEVDPRKSILFNSASQTNTMVSSTPNSISISCLCNGLHFPQMPVLQGQANLYSDWLIALVFEYTIFQLACCCNQAFITHLENRQVDYFIPRGTRPHTFLSLLAKIKVLVFILISFILIFTKRYMLNLRGRDALNWADH